MASDTFADSDERDKLFSVSFNDQYELIVGPPGARGLPEPGRQVVPPHPKFDYDRSVRSQIELRCQAEGLTVKADRWEREIKAKRFDFGSMKDIHDVLVATGSGAAVWALLRGSRQLVVEWLKGRATREITVKVPDGTQVCIKGDNDIAKAVQVLDQFRAKTAGRASTRRPHSLPSQTHSRKRKRSLALVSRGLVVRMAMPPRLRLSVSAAAIVLPKR